jgi:hypothetical protein
LAWRHTPLWRGSDLSVRISYQQQADGLNAFLLLANIVSVRMGPP